MNKISTFDGEYRWLSNFWPAILSIWGLEFSSVEAAYQAAKCAKTEDRLQFTTMNAAQAKKAGRRIQLRADWNSVKLAVMEELLRLKFVPHSELWARLMHTKPMELIEGNYWRDTFWGVCNGVGSNHLGRLLMKIRDEEN